MLQLGYLSVLLLIATSGSAQAYIDPGVGSILLQSLIAVIATVSVTCGHYWHRVKNFFKSGKSASEPAKGQTAEPD